MICHKCRLVGLLGGSFNPPHQGHIHISNLALKLFGLDEVWWLVSPGNPLKIEKPASFQRRYERAQSIIHNPRIRVSDFEYAYRIHHTFETISKLNHRYPDHLFIWLMGSDNLVQFDQWKNWGWIFRNIPIAVLSRTKSDLPSLASKAARAFSQNYIPSNLARSIVYHEPPVWTLVKTPNIHVSSSQYRAKGLWNGV
ncbi:MAG: nicotinate (nicotinamide) nucleotide adenylyltransferase [Rhodobacteraceae bacterium]|nr:nicotinate (nicotinamide) nucleotide adenylyltransferase [Paracoccaceae bacterium]